MMALFQVLEMLRGIAENMVAVVNTALKCFSGMQHLLLDGEGAVNVCVSYPPAGFHREFFVEGSMHAPYPLPPPPQNFF